MRLLTINSGSSNVKLAIFEADGGEEVRRLASARAETRHGQVLLRLVEAAGRSHELRAPAIHADVPGVVLALLDRVWPIAGFDAVGHRIVHGGEHYRQPHRLDGGTLTALRDLVPLAPLHQAANLAYVDAASRLRASLQQVGCFDTAFHATLPDVARRFALPRRFEAQGIRRYGFHGLSYQSIVRQLRRCSSGLAEGRVIVAHLGAGASLCAMHEGRSIDTSMGFSALDGLPMATRCGALDPGVVLHLVLRLGMAACDVESILYRESGLLGVSGLSADVRDLLASDSDAAREAIELFVQRIASGIGACTVTLGGLDSLVFTGGIGENQPLIRAAVAERLSFLGVQLDSQSNESGGGPIHADGSRIEVWTLPADEEAEIARGTLAALVAE